MSLVPPEGAFETEEGCVAYLAALRWSNGFFCPACGHRRAWAGRGILLRCAGCGYQTSATARNVFHNTQLPLRSWFLAIWYVVTQGERSRAKDVQRLLGLSSYRTAWLIFQKIEVVLRHVKERRVRPQGSIIGGNGEVAIRWGLEPKEDFLGADENQRWSERNREWFSRPATSSQALLFCRVLKQAVALPPAPYRDLIGSGVQAESVIPSTAAGSNAR